MSNSNFPSSRVLRRRILSFAIPYPLPLFDPGDGSGGWIAWALHEEKVYHTPGAAKGLDIRGLWGVARCISEAESTD